MPKITKRPRVHLRQNNNAVAASCSRGDDTSVPMQRQSPTISVETRKVSFEDGSTASLSQPLTPSSSGETLSPPDEHDETGKNRVPLPLHRDVGVACAMTRQRTPEEQLCDMERGSSCPPTPSVSPTSVEDSSPWGQFVDVIPCSFPDTFLPSCDSFRGNRWEVSQERVAPCRSYQPYVLPSGASPLRRTLRKTQKSNALSDFVLAIPKQAASDGSDECVSMALKAMKM